MAKGFLLVVFLAGLFWAGCMGEHEPYHYTRKEIVKLLAGDSARIWQRTRKNVNGANIALAGCEKYQYLALAYNPKNPDQTFYAVFNTSGHADCRPGEDQISILDSGRWVLLSDPTRLEGADTVALYDSIFVDQYKTIVEITSTRVLFDQIDQIKVIKNRDTLIRNDLVREWYERTN